MSKHTSPRRAGQNSPSSMATSLYFRLLLFGVISMTIVVGFHSLPFSADSQWQFSSRDQGRPTFYTTSPLTRRHLASLDWSYDARRPKPQTLVIYTFSDTDAEYRANLQHFVSEAIREDDGCYYIIVVQQEANGKPVLLLPDLPSNAHYEFHFNTCFDYGTVGWLLEEHKFDPAHYRYFIFVNSSVRGPFLPAYWPKHEHWSRILTSRLSDTVKLVGPTINCEGSHRGGEFASIWRINPHVQSFVMATDQIGMQLLMDDGNVFGCHANFHDTIYYSELGASAVLLDAGYNLDSLMLRYQGIDWRDKANWACNGRVNPTGEHHYDGMSLDPLEVLFVKMKDHMRQLSWVNVVQAASYQHWHEGILRGEPDVLSNRWLTKGDELRLPRILTRQYLGDACFDHNFYRNHNKDLPSPLQTSDGALWKHFLMHGEHEGRNFRFTCTPSLPSDQKAAYAEAQAIAEAAAGTGHLPQEMQRQLQQKRERDPRVDDICVKLFGPIDKDGADGRYLFSGHNEYMRNFLGCP